MTAQPAPHPFTICDIAREWLYHRDLVPELEATGCPTAAEYQFHEAEIVADEIRHRIRLLPPAA